MRSHKYAYLYMYGFLVTLIVRVVGSKHWVARPRVLLGCRP